MENTNTNSKNTIKPLILIVVVLAILIALFLTFSGNTGAVAVVDGETISQKEYQQEYQKAITAIQSLNSETELTEEMKGTLKDEVLNQLIAERLVIQYAAKNNMTFTEEEFNQEYAMTVGLIGGEEALGEYLESFKLSQESFEKDVRNQILFRKSVENYADKEKLQVTDQEVKEAYDELIAQAQTAGLEGDVPPLETVSEWFRAQLRNQKIAEEGGPFIEQLKEQAKIEVLVK